MITQGTWGNLLGPVSNLDFGLTERYAPWLGVNPNQQQTQQTQQTPSVSSLFGGGTPGQINQAAMGAQSPMSPQKEARIMGTSPSGGGGQVLSSSTEGGGTDDLSALYAEIDNIYNETMSYLGGQEQSLRTNQPGVEAGVEGQYAASRMSAETEKGVGERDLATAGTAAGQRKEDALGAGRRLFNELKMGGQQRFGGASSAGEAYSELTGREFQRGQATTQQAFQNAMTKVMDLGANLRERFDSAMFNLETQKNNALNQVRQTFQERLSQIDALRAEAGTNKSTMRLDLLSELRNQVYQINLASVQTQSQLDAQRQNAEQELTAVVNAVKSSQTGAGQATTNLLGETTTNPQTAYAVTSGRQAPGQTYTGQIAPRREEELFA